MKNAIPTPTPEFKAFMGRLTKSHGTATDNGQGGYLLLQELENVFKNFTAGQTLSRNAQSCIFYLYNEFEILGIDTLTVDEIKALKVSSSTSRSCGYAIEAPLDNVFVRYKMAFFDKMQRPNPIAGAETLRHRYTRDYCFETHPMLSPLSDLWVMDKSLNLQPLMQFNEAVLRVCGYAGEIKPEMSDFGVRFFTQQDNKWQHVQNVDCTKLNYQEGKCTTEAGQVVLPVPYLFDTEELTPTMSSHEEKMWIAMLADRNGQLVQKEPFQRCTQKHDLVKSYALTTEMMKNMAECYLAYDQRRQKQSIAL